jgi:DNA-binding transcriptional LysR family regulator
LKIDRLSTLKVFVSAVDAGSISRAAHRHGLSTTSASRRLMELEQELGVRLLDRTTRYVAPTEAGRRLRDRVAPLVAGVELALREVGEDLHLPSGTLRILARRSFAMLHIAPLLPKFLAAHPNVAVDLQLTEAVEIVPGEDVDLVVRLGAPVEKTLVSHRLASGRRILAASPDYLARAGMPAEVEDVGAHDCLTYRRAETGPVWIFETPAGLRELQVRGPLRATNGEVLREAAVAGLGLILLPAWMIASDIAAGRLVRCLPQVVAWPSGFDREIAAVHRRVEPVPAKIAAFMSHLEGRRFEGDLAGRP